MSRDGRRQAIVLLLGVVSIAIFALWSLINVVGDGVGGVEWVTVLLMLGILLVAPLVAWTLLEEAQVSVQADDKGITYKTVGGINLLYLWQDVVGFKPTGGRGRVARFFLGDEKEDGADARTNDEQPPSGAPAENVADEEPGTLLLDVRRDPSQQIANPMVRFLHKQAYGSALPIHGSLQERQQLIEEINRRVGQATD